MLNTTTLRAVYLAIVQSIINYGIVTWENALAISLLITTLNSLLRFVVLKTYNSHLNGSYLWDILIFIFMYMYNILSN